MNPLKCGAPKQATLLHTSSATVGWPGIWGSAVLTFVRRVVSSCEHQAVWQVEKLLGSGSYGRVYRVQRVADGKTYALKQMSVHKMSASERQGAMNEVRLACDCWDFHVRLDLSWLPGWTQAWPCCRYGCSPPSAVPTW